MLKKKSGTLCLVCALLLSLLVLPAQAAGAIGVTIDGASVVYSDDAPFLDKQNRTQVPFRTTMEAFGCEVDWNAATRTAIAEKGNTKVEITVGQFYMTVNGITTAMDTAAQLINDRTYLPIRPVLEAFGASVTWNSQENLVVVTTGSNLVRVYFLDVGQGDATFIDCGETEVLIDGGSNGAGDQVVSAISPYVDGKLDYIIATHPDADHIGGLDTVLEAFEVGEVIDSGCTSDTRTYADYMAAVKAEGCTLSYDEDRIIALNAMAALSVIETGDDWAETNDQSVVAQLTCGNVQVLFPGDMSESAERMLLPLFGDIDVLKVSHHGSASSTCTEFLEVVKPEYAVVSYGVGNSYHHPTAETLQRLFAAGTTVYGTGKSGTVVLTTDGWTYSFNTTQALTLADAGA